MPEDKIRQKCCCVKCGKIFTIDFTKEELEKEAGEGDCIVGYSCDECSKEIKNGTQREKKD